MFKSLTLATAFVVSLGSSAFAAQTYAFDPGHTEVRFGWSHAGVSRQHGEFTKVDGTLSLDKDNISASTITVTIDAASVSTGVTALDDHLKNADFLEVDTYPTITFNSTSVTQTGDSTADIAGDLTIHGVTKPVVLKATLTHIGKHPLGSIIDYYKGQWVAFNASTMIENHQDYGVGNFSTGPLEIVIDTEMKATE